MNQVPRVVIAGAGFGGLTCARALKRAPVEVLLVDRNNYHLFTPLLYQVASALLDPGEIARPVRQLIRPLRNADFLQASINGVDFAARRLLTDHGPIPYDYLVLATGAQSDYFGNRSIAEHTLGLKDLDEGLAIRNRVLSQFEASRWTTDAAERRRLLTFVVAGGGPTGVEMAGAISELIRLVLRKDYRDLDTNEVRVVLIEAAPHVLVQFVPSLRQAALRSLERKGVEVMLNAKVETVGAGSLKVAGGDEIPAGMVIWTAGVKASDIGGATGLQLARQARITVDPTLQVPGHPVVFVIGDLAGAKDGEALLPMLIPVAMQAGKHAAACIAEMVGRGGARAFQYKDPGIMATIGRNSAVAQIRGFHFSGFVGWVIWLTVHLINIVSFRSRLVVLINWAWEYLFYDRPVRIIVRARD
ncbi:MAG: NAD(P)/FAD-dependent oxidoreductase [Chloroflexi bacterium]|nr:MAG: NAD(P)/FAD-dependent oxidoreductase [Chloroflexota bacterium]